jgi:glutamine synthetase
VRFYCDIKSPDGSVFPNDGRVVLKRVVKRALNVGYTCKIGVECEFYLFKTGEDGEPTTETLDRGGYLDISPLDRGEDIRREICLALEEMGMSPEASHHEQGPGQHEIDFKFSDALECADNFQTFKSTIKAIASRNGLFASFMPKPLPDVPGSGMHINLSLYKDGKNIFSNVGKNGSSSGSQPNIAESFIAGVLAMTPQMSLFLNPLSNSYDRLGKCDAPKYVSWSHQNRSQLIRIPAAAGEKVRMELRSPDSSLNPYLAFALILAAGLDGVENKLTLPAAVDVDLYTADNSITKDLALLPDSLEKAISLVETSSFVKSVIGDELLLKYIELKKAEAKDYAAAGDKSLFYKDRYFRVI